MKRVAGQVHRCRAGRIAGQGGMGREEGRKGEGGVKAMQGSGPAKRLQIRRTHIIHIHTYISLFYLDTVIDLKGQSSGSA